MENITIKKEALEYALHMLDTQCEHIQNAGGKAAQERQRCYYVGMRDMLSILITQAYTDPSIILWTTRDNKHTVKRMEDIL